ERSQTAYLLEQRDDRITDPHFETAWGAFHHDRILDWRRLKGSVAHLYLTILASTVARSTGRTLVSDMPGMRLLAESVRIGYPLPGTILIEGGRALPIKDIFNAQADKITASSMHVAVVEL